MASIFWGPIPAILPPKCLAEAREEAQPAPRLGSVERAGARPPKGLDGVPGIVPGRGRTVG